MAFWKRPFKGVSNVQSTVAEEMITSEEDLLTLPMDTVEEMREEVEQVASRLKNGKSAGSDDMVAELVNPL